MLCSKKLYSLTGYDIIQRHFPNGICLLDVSSSSCDIFVDRDKTRILKLFKDIRNVDRLYRAEVRTLRILNSVTTKHVPTMYAHHCFKDCDGKLVMFIILSYNGVDGIELMNKNNFTVEMLDEFVKQIPKVIQTLHVNKIAHGDIKPENCVYDCRYKIWSIIDFGLVKVSTSTKRNAFGTYPYVLPALGSKDMHSIYKSKYKHIPLVFVHDYFSLAFTVLNMFGIVYEYTSNNTKVVVCKEQIFDLCVGGTTDRVKQDYLPINFEATESRREYLQICAQIVISQTDVTNSHFMWDMKNGEFSQNGIPTTTIDKYNEDLTGLWNDMLSISREKSTILIKV